MVNFPIATLEQPIRRRGYILPFPRHHLYMLTLDVDGNTLALHHLLIQMVLYLALGLTHCINCPNVVVKPEFMV